MTAEIRTTFDIPCQCGRGCKPGHCVMVGSQSPAAPIDDVARRRAKRQRLTVRPLLAERLWLVVGSDARCDACERDPYCRSDGVCYLYVYTVHGPAVCSPRCDRKCTCQAPRVESGAALMANDCPVHTENPCAT